LWPASAMPAWRAPEVVLWPWPFPLPLCLPGLADLTAGSPPPCPKGRPIAKPVGGRWRCVTCKQAGLGCPSAACTPRGCSRCECGGAHEGGRACCSALSREGWGWVLGRACSGVWMHNSGQGARRGGPWGSHRSCCHRAPAHPLAAHPQQHFPSFVPPRLPCGAGPPGTYDGKTFRVFRLKRAYRAYARCIGCGKGCVKCDRRGCSKCARGFRLAKGACKPRVTVRPLG